jgi:hypothetical protein
MAACLIATGIVLAGAPAQAYWFDIDTVPAVKGNDTGGIIAYPLAMQADARQIAADHCGRYGKVAKFLGAQAYPGGYISFACRWVPYGTNERPLRTRY